MTLMWVDERADTPVGNAMAPLPLPRAVSKPRQGKETTAPDAQLVLGQWAEIFTHGSLTPLHGFVFSLRPGEVLFTFPDLLAAPDGLEAGHDVVVRYASRTGRHTGHAAILRVAGGPPVTAALQRLVRVETEQRRPFPRLSVRVPATLVAREESQPPVGQPSDAQARMRSAGGASVETSLPAAAGDEVKLTVPGPARSAAKRARQAGGKVLRVASAGKRRAAGVEFSFTSDDERNAWAQLVQALRRKGK
jgi:hypothetical protein